MANGNDEIVKLILQIKGQDEARDLAKAHQDLRAQILAAVAAHNTLDAALGDPAVRKATAELHAMEADLAKLNRTLAGSHNGLASNGQAMIAWSRALQDFQAAGFAGITNNLETMASSIGAPAFAAGLATIVGVFGPPLIRAVSEFVSGLLPAEEKLNKAADAAGRLKDQIKAIEEKPVKLAVDLISLDNARAKLSQLEAGAQAYQAALQGRTVDEVKSGTAVKELFAEGLMPGEQRKLIEQAGANRTKQLMGQDGPMSELQKKLEDSRRDLEQYTRSAERGDAGAARTRDAITAEILEIEEKLRVRRIAVEKDARAQVGDTFKDAQSGDSQGIEDLAGMLGGAGRGDLADALRRRTAAEIGDFEDDKGDPKHAESTGKQAASRMGKIRQADKQAGKQAEQKRVQGNAEIAKEMAAGPLGDAYMAAGTITPDAVFDELSKLIDPAEAAAATGEMRGMIVKELAEKVAKRIAETGQAEPEARADLADESRAAKAQAKKAKGDQRAAHREQQDRLKEQAAGNRGEITDQASADALYFQMTGEDPTDEDPEIVRREVNNRLKNQNKGDDATRKKAERAGQAVARGPMEQQIGLALERGGNPELIAKAVGAMMQRQGMVPKGFEGEAGTAAVGAVKAGLDEKLLGLQAGGLNALQAHTAIQGQMMQEVMKQGAQLEQVMMMLNGQRNRMQQHQRSAMSRSRQ